MLNATGYAGLATGRAITGLAAASWVPLTVLFSSQFPPAEAVRATALLSLINGFSRMVATSTTGTLNRLGGFGLAFSISIGAAGLAIMALLPVREVVRPPKRPVLGDIGRLITRRDVLLPSLLNALGEAITWTTTFGFLPILARNLGASGEIQSLLITLNIAISMGGNLLTSTIARRVGSLRLLYASYAVLAAGIAVAATAHALPAIFLAQVLLGLGSGICYPLCMGLSIQNVDDTQRATAMGLHQAVYGTGMFAGPWLSGILANAIGIQPMFAVVGAVCLGLSVGLARLLDRK
jgi:MFS family permease